MASRYEKYIVRKSAIIKGATPEGISIEVPKGDKIPSMSKVDTGPLIMFSDDFLKGATTKVEYGFITGDTEIGTGKGFGAHKHDYEEIFLFLGTNPRDTNYLGAEAEYWLGRRRGFPQDSMEPNNIPLVVLGAGLLWFGWFGFNAGSALTAGGLASNVFVTTNTAAAAAAFTWMIISWIQRRPTILGTVTGAIAGLATVTPAAGYISPLAAIPVGIIAAIVCYYVMLSLKTKFGFDDSLDVFAVHGVGGILGMLFVGIFASLAVNPAGADGLIAGSFTQLWKQLVGIVAVGAYSFLLTLILGKLIDKTMGLRVGQVEETVGLDISQHGERAYGGTIR